MATGAIHSTAQLTAPINWWLYVDHNPTSRTDTQEWEKQLEKEKREERQIKTQIKSILSRLIIKISFI